MKSAPASTERPDDERAAWPYAAMIGFGYFGSDTAEGRRHRRRSYAGLALFALGMAGAPMTPLPWALRVTCGAAIPLAWALIVWSNVRYTASLDELTRLIQLEAAALSYGVVMVLASVWFALGALRVFEAIDMASTLDERQVRSWIAMLFFVSVALAEVARGFLLVALARRRR